MRTTIPSTLLMLFAAAACAAPPRAPKPHVPPPRGPAHVAEAPPRQSNEEATRRFLDREIERQSPPVAPDAPRIDAPRQQTNEEATRRYLDEEIERRGLAQADMKPPPPPPPAPPVVERVVPMQWPEEYGWRYGTPAYDGYGHEYHWGPTWRRPYVSRYHHGHSVVGALPWYTAYGAGVGALFGRAAGHTGRGAAIGAGVGLLLDMGRWRW